MVSLLKKGQHAIAIVGTAHISEESATLVKDVIHAITPDTVMVELDGSRAKRLVQKLDGEPTVDQGYSPGSIVKRLLRFDFKEAGSNAVGYGISSLYKKLDTLGFQSGAEFVTAIREAEKLGAIVLLGDQDARVTLGRLRDAIRELLSSGALSAALSRSEEDINNNPAFRRLANAAKLGASDGELTREGVMSSLAVLQQRDAVRALTTYMREELPPLYSALIAERDAYMARSLLSRSESRRAVAVVGLAHVDGIESHLRDAGYGLVSCRELKF